MNHEYPGTSATVDDAERYLYTTLGLLGRDKLGMILPHEHVFVDLRTPDKPGYGEADEAEVVAVMAPKIEEIKRRGVTALVECSTTGVGRRADFDLAVSRATSFPIVVPTGSYREPWITPSVREADDEALEAWMFHELSERFEEADYRAGWIKLSAGDDGITWLEERILRAAARAAARTGAVIGSHTMRGRVAMAQLDVIEQEGHSPDRFLWIHTQNETDLGYHDEAVSRGAWIEYDHVSRAPDEEVKSLILRALEAGYANNLLISHDVGWFDPAKPGGGVPRSYTHLSDVMMPSLKASGVDDGTLKVLSEDNPFRAYSRPG
ncbi:phosphotriesterase family protein [Chelativorans xinjiangense]|uniref:phosphotriesterase family protein n=1 Tax=Chelativorans xinjiangense TaxID=2681485 RepID=UPI001FE590AD|nr:esterase [Chelativorans xinjiangense]